MTCRDAAHMSVDRARAARSARPAKALAHAAVEVELVRLAEIGLASRRAATRAAGRELARELERCHRLTTMVTVSGPPGVYSL